MGGCSCTVVNFPQNAGGGNERLRVFDAQLPGVKSQLSGGASLCLGFLDCERWLIGLCKDMSVSISKEPGRVFEIGKD